MSGKENNNKVTPKSLLQYEQGDLIVKQGGYGNAIYRLKKGRVEMYTESPAGKNVLSFLESDDIFGETAFPPKSMESNPASIRAVEDAQIEVWHINHLVREFEAATPILRQIFSQTLDRLQKARKMLIQLQQQIQAADLKKRKLKEEEERYKNMRKHYRKEVQLKCVYRPAGAQADVLLTGLVKDISREGVGLETGSRMSSRYPHEVGHRFRLKTTLPNGQDVEMEATIVSVRKGSAPQTYHLGMKITDISSENLKRLGFFLMP